MSEGPSIIAFTATLIAAFVYGSFFEWVVHRFLMHRPTRGLRHIFKGHAEIHHGVYRGDSTYVTGDREPEEVTFAWWLMPGIPLLHVPPAIGLFFLFGLPSAIGLLVGVVLYQAIYEYSHYSMHVPQGRWIERRRLFRWVNDQHLQHHRKHFTNLNVFFPIADFVLGTRHRCADPTTTAVTAEVGYLPDHRRPPRSQFAKKAGRETVWLLRQVSRRVRRAGGAPLP